MTYIEERIAALEERVASLEARVNELEGRPSLPETLNISEAAELLGLHRNTIAGWIREGKLPAQKVGREMRIKREDLLQVVEE